jgi:gluconate 2-dehydrogenase gamma chain
MTRAITRRQLIVRGALLTTGATLFGLVDGKQGESHTGAMPGPAVTTSNPESITGTQHIFFSDSEAAFVAAAVDRLIPNDELGPGALEAGCVLFIDRQLAGAYGRAESWYMQGPWPDGDEQQGAQSRMSPAETYRISIAAIDEDCRIRFNGKRFGDLIASEQDQVLLGLEKGEPLLPGINVKPFFAMLLQNTMEGFFADPLYGGNRDMIGWTLIGFPGARYDHRAAVDKHGEPYLLPPVGILGRKAWS